MQTLRGVVFLASMLSTLAGCRTAPTQSPLLAQLEAARMDRNRAGPAEAAQRSARLPRVLELEKSAAGHEAAGDLPRALSECADALQYLGPHSDEALEARLRERALTLAGKISPAPPPPGEAQRLAIRAMAMIQNATRDEELGQAITEFESATRVAPWWADAYYNLALAQEKAGEPGEAARTWKFYLLANLSADDSAALERRVIELGVGAEKLSEVRKAELAAAHELEGDFGLHRLKANYLNQTIHVCTDSPGQEFFQGPRLGGGCNNLITENEFARRFHAATGKSTLDDYDRRRNMAYLIAAPILVIGGAIAGGIGLGQILKPGCTGDCIKYSAITISSGIVSMIIGLVFLGSGDAEGKPQDRTLGLEDSLRAVDEYNDAIRPR